MVGSEPESAERSLLESLLSQARELGASDLHLKVGLPTVFRIDGRLHPAEAEPLTAEQTRAFAEIVLVPHQMSPTALGELDVGFSAGEAGRFRCNVYSQRGTIGVVFRVLSPQPLTIRDLNLPEVMEQVVVEERGLVLVTGATGSGKSTALAGMIDFINQVCSRHIITIEDPIEFFHEDLQSIVTQRQLGLDTQSFADALRASLRQDPDVILIGEMRDKETIDAAILAAETGHLVFSTLHTLDAAETVNRVLAAFPPHQQDQVRLQLADLLRAVFSMRLVPRADGNGMVPAVEVLINTRYISDCIRDPKRTKSIRDALEQGYSEYSTQTFDQSLLGLYKQDLIDKKTALTFATNRSDLDLKIKGIVSGIEAGRPAGQSGALEH